MISPRKLVIASVSAVAAFAGFALPAAASPPATATGTLTVLPATSFNVLRDTNGVVRFQTTGTTVYAGDLVGPVTGTNTFTTALAPLRQAGHGMGVCNSCTLGGRTGGFTDVVSFTAVGTSFTGTLTFISGTGGLAGLHGTGSFQGIGGPPPDFGTYSISYQFGP